MNDQKNKKVIQEFFTENQVEDSDSEPEDIILPNKGKAAPKAAPKQDNKKKAQNDESDDTSFDEEDFKPKAGATKGAAQKKPVAAVKKAV